MAESVQSLDFVKRSLVEWKVQNWARGTPLERKGKTLFACEQNATLERR